MHHETQSSLSRNPHSTLSREPSVRALPHRASCYRMHIPAAPFLPRRETPFYCYSGGKK
ncbi:hypothetical protein PUNSTDRAFT_55999 [Punctularia strigosozonata HHB-11173 SS5]|uniref:Uncharacterized protein n=1 Tax=Punctularia strigosozonata (strain HHB-11173) TaxID=741275 RepID=R7S3E4_PUNST|nr:uncharacterized protein PUNSTDRAFT_55999 [Punctularia strigosozonata HHB-11173 SS5]EIN03736.1 hypothetical protein PUNSTDRAFT_55999 [Punctularia strigosozonata HHB-11173 SS5]